MRGSWHCGAEVYPCLSFILEISSGGKDLRLKPKIVSPPLPGSTNPLILMLQKKSPTVAFGSRLINVGNYYVGRMRRRPSAQLTRDKINWVEKMCGV